MNFEKGAVDFLCLRRIRDHTLTLIFDLLFKALLYNLHDIGWVLQVLDRHLKECKLYWNILLAADLTMLGDVLYCKKILIAHDNIV